MKLGDVIKRLHILAELGEEVLREGRECDLVMVDHDDVEALKEAQDILEGVAHVRKLMKREE